MKIQILQLPIVFGDTDKNEQQILHYFNTYIDDDTEVVALPEMWNNGYDLENLNATADKSLQRSLAFIKNLALTYHVDIIAGSVSNIKDNQKYNTAFAVTRAGQLINTYDKVHLVPMLNEPQFLSAGQHAAEAFKLSNGTLVTQLICYDLRFPEILRYPARQGANIAFYVAQWPTARVKHWHALLKARAIENNMYVIGINGCGFDGYTEYAGQSIVIDPNGETIASLDQHPNCLTVDVNLEKVEQQRQAIPVFDSIKVNLYK
ncbi:carbon-nitrogen family hydrolase [Staphylococcus simiae]|uniref:CN hydrolase domain-containing protein n=1 Tax=Staphylococcus simiae CCM 7213 = CCUG 51256 TaxID=911238 RepID=G5JKU0_9STAP|nr:carbon-nitrogen family hydrolase [Staphylococcus simiae]EHJ07219.1 hypothetical protein SS7213T_10509 [Staphylococcus simiae CCM 7213 = CCUG 51256]PNZ14618.1 carbon-nitrogen family hydrolase [Staphylococcus simiae]SNV76481.1 putative carbon-nitrogen hydrolase [Staphylococcus simiae]